MSTGLEIKVNKAGQLTVNGQSYASARKTLLDRIASDRWNIEISQKDLNQINEDIAKSVLAGNEMASDLRRAHLKRQDILASYQADLAEAIAMLDEITAAKIAHKTEKLISAAKADLAHALDHYDAIITEKTRQLRQAQLTR
ncbi:hypothetical protein [Methylocaldum sp.]|uniref:hypothetical protein n=1 Tax=Methylocaldum sp. TaxID=1969727 RepID=UPI002D31E3C0|nr:hypothetical protein [Methylocaldum sp.]HYE36128.1 hypothetical protein [Methylocaldum sp.]